VALALTLGAIVAVFRFRLGMGVLLATWGALGLAWSAVGGVA
jgi:hypothetical protein